MISLYKAVRKSQVDFTVGLMGPNVLEIKLMGPKCSLVPRPSIPPVFDRLQYAKTEAIKSWRCGKPRNEANQMHDGKFPHQHSHTKMV